MTIKTEKELGAIAKRPVLRAEIPALAAKYNELDRLIDRTRREVDQLEFDHNQQAEAIYNRRGRPAGKTPAQFAEADPDLCRLKAQIDEKKRAVVDAEARLKSVGERSAAAGRDVYTWPALSLAAVLDHQQALADAEAVVLDLETRIAKERQLITRAEQFEHPPLAEMDAECDILAAKVALGEAAEGDLKALNGRRETAHRAFADFKKGIAKKVDDASAVIRGLEERLVTVSTERDRLRLLSSDVIACAIKTEIEAAGVEYRESAARLVESYSRIRGLIAVAKVFDPKITHLATIGNGKTDIPLFRIDALSNTTPVTKYEDGRDFDVFFTSGRFEESKARSAEVKRLRAAGVNLPGVEP